MRRSGSRPCPVGATTVFARAFLLLLPLLTAATGSLVGLMGMARATLRDLCDLLESGAGWSSVPLDQAIAAIAVLALNACALWLVTVIGATAVEALTGASSSVLRSISPRVVRRLVLVCCGVAVGSAGILAPATAVERAQPPGHPSGPSPREDQAATSLVGLPLPDRVAGHAPPPRPARRAGPEPSGPPAQVDLVTVAALTRQTKTYVVRPGDSLWSIAERLLSGADAAEVDTAWRQIHRANHRVIGTDPDLIVPGMTLRIPALRPTAPHSEGPGDPGAPHHRKDAS